uniref:Uncharacterized protein n=1 Tax=Strongyloides papillosus TaxID=174720 RepID=A0A0N5B3P7_STREA
MRFLLVQLFLITFICLTISAKKGQIKKPRGLQNPLHDDYVRCKEECKKIEEREVTEKYIQYLRTELEAAELVAAQEQALLQSTISTQTGNQNVNNLNNPITENDPSTMIEATQKETTEVVNEVQKETFAQEENLIV